MPPNRAQTKRKVVPSRRAYENSLPRTTARPPPRRTLKQPSQTPEHIDLTSNDLLDLESKQQASRKPPKPQEPLPTKYALSIKVFVDKVSICAQSMLQTAGAFDYARFIGIEAEKTSEYCARLGRDVNAIRTSRATIAYNKKNSFESDIDNKSKKDVQVSWTITRQLKALSVEPGKEAPKLHEDESEHDAQDDDEEKAEKTRSFKKNTTTKQRLAEARAAPHSAVTNELLQIYKCRTPGCRNSAAYCYLAGGANGEHYALSAASIRQWAEAVEDGTATVHSLLASLVSWPSSSEGTLDLQSSPTDLCVVTSQYIAWYRKKYLEQERFLDNVAEQLAAGAYDLQGITELHKEDWRFMEIPDELDKQLVQNVAKFVQQRDSI
ncbi:MAG: hypothetical protein M1813_000948 [Trichoglossum hirsutum]|nr:MAG: hypothetical protein M1813_000948 [Trichoglossum hirsutum]